MRNTLVFLIIFVFVYLLFPDASEVNARRGGGRSRYSRSRSYRSDSRYRSYRSYRSGYYDNSYEESGGGGGLSIGAIVGMVIASILVIAVGILLVYYFFSGRLILYITLSGALAYRVYVQSVVRRIRAETKTE